MRNVNRLQTALNEAIKNIICEFSEKHELCFLFWNNETTFEVAHFDDGFQFTFNDILFDLFTNQHPMRILLYFQHHLQGEINKTSYELFIDFQNMH